jgi:hypothetical protein
MSAKKLLLKLWVFLSQVQGTGQTMLWDASRGTIQSVIRSQATLRSKIRSTSALTRAAHVKAQAEPYVVVASAKSVRVLALESQMLGQCLVNAQHVAKAARTFHVFNNVTLHMELRQGLKTHVAYSSRKRSA